MRKIALMLAVSFSLVTSTTIAMASEKTHLLWTDSGIFRVHVANLTTSVVSLISPSSSFELPGESAWDPKTNKLFIATRSKIVRMNLDGTGVVTVADTAFGFVARFFAIDPFARKLYWLEFGSVKRADMDGLNANIEILPMSAPAIGRLIVDTIRSKLYFLDAGGLKSANLDGTNETVMLPRFVNFTVHGDPVLHRFKEFAAIAYDVKNNVFYGDGVEERLTSPSIHTRVGLVRYAPGDTVPTFLHNATWDSSTWVQAKSVAYDPNTNIIYYTPLAQIQDIKQFDIATGVFSTRFVSQPTGASGSMPSIVSLISTTDCLMDVNFDGSVGPGDLLFVLAGWGTPFGPSHLLDLLAQWGCQ